MHTTDVSLSKLPQPLRALFLHWQDLRGKAPAPALVDMDVHQLVARFENLVLVEVLRAEQAIIEDFRVIYLSCQLRRVLTRDFTGNTLRTLPGKGPDSLMWRACCTAVKHARPVVTQAPFLGPTHGIASSHDVLLPLCDDAGAVGYVLAGIAPGQHARTPLAGSLPAH